MAKVIGIDLGTTNSCMAVVDPATGHARVLPNREGERTTPSVVGFDVSGKVTVGSAALASRAVSPRSCSTRRLKLMKSAALRCQFL